MQILKSFIDNMMRKPRFSSKTEVPPFIEGTDVPILEEIKVGEALETTIQADSLQATEDEKVSILRDTEDVDSTLGSDNPVEENAEISDLEEQELDITQLSSETDKLQKTDDEQGSSMPFADEIPPSLLDNKPFVKLAEECVDVMEEFDGYIERLESDEGRMISEMIVKRLQELLERSGLQRIDDVDEPFSILRHNPVPMVPVSEGELLEKILQPGLMLDNRVFRKAKVKVKEPHKNI